MATSAAAKLALDWMRACNAGEADEAVALCAADLAIVGPRGIARGPELLRDWLERANATFAPRRVFCRGDEVVLDQRGLWREADGAPKGEADVATRITIAGRRVARVERYEALAEALRAAEVATDDETADTLGDVRNFAAVDGLATGGQPTEAQLRAAAAGGHEVVINLGLLDPRYCLPDEAGLVTSLGLAYHHIPVVFGAPQVDEFRRFLAVMDEIEGRPTFVHCALNWRVSAFVALYGQCRRGWSRQRADAHAGRFWSPNETWQAFMAACRRAHRLDD